MKRRRRFGGAGGGDRQRAAADRAAAAGDVTLAEWPVPRALTVLPRLSVTATFAFTVPLLPRLVTVQAKTQLAPRLPALRVTLVKPHLEAARGETVIAIGVLEIVPSLTATLADSAR